MPKIQRRILPLTSAAAVAVLAVGVLASPASAASTGNAKKKVDINRVAYTTFIRTAAVETYADIPRNTPQEFGYSGVDLRKDIEEALPRCTADGAGYWAGEVVEEGVLEGGAAPIEEGQTRADGAKYQNPTIKRTFRPNATAVADNTSNRTPSFPSNGNGPLWTSDCTDGFFTGTGTGDIINAGGSRIAGSTTTGTVDQKTGIYTGTARAYITSIKGAFDTMTSLMQIRFEPNKEPVITYRLAFFNSDASKSGFNNDGFTLAGTAIPANDFVNTFNTQAASFAQQGAAFGPAGLQILSPTVYPDQDTGRMTITAPAASGNLGFASRAGGIGQNFGARFASITFIGDNVTG